MTNAARRDENTATRMPKSARSRNVIYASEGQSSPTAARISEMMDGEGMREPEYAERKQLSVHGKRIGGRSVLTRGSWRGLEDEEVYRDRYRRYDGQYENLRYFMPCGCAHHRDRLDVHAPTCAYPSISVIAADLMHLR
jgi:hypothetical protein